LLLSSSQLAINLAAEMFLYMAARAQLVEDVVRPALDRGECVISDRYLLANVVYQGYAGGLDVDALWRIGTLATGGVQPDLTFVLDLDPSMAASRRNSPPDRLERRGLAYFERVRAGFLAEAVRQPHAIAVVDASRDPHSVEHEIRRLAEPIVQKELPG
jgi:dTMP kinase